MKNAAAFEQGEHTAMRKLFQLGLPVLVACLIPSIASAQNFRVQCPLTTTLHPGAKSDQGAVKCQQISGGDGYATMADGTQTYLFSFGPLSGLNDIANGMPGTQTADVFMTPYDPAAGPNSKAANGAVGLIPDMEALPLNNRGNNPCFVNPNRAGCYSGHVDPRQIMDVGVMNGNIPAPMMAIDEDDEFFLTLTNVGMIMRPDLFEQHTVHFHGYPNASSFYDGVPDASVAINIGGSFTYYYLAPDAGTYFWHCHITPPEHLQMGMVGQLYVRPRQNRVQNNGSLFANLVQQQADRRTACYSQGLTVGSYDPAHPDVLCSSPLPATNHSATHGTNQNGDPTLFAYNDGDGSTAYDVEYPVQIHGFDPSFHFVGMTFNPEQFVDMKDKYFLLNGRSYPDTVQTSTYVDPGASTGNSDFVGQPRVSNAIYTQDADGVARPSQPLSAVINIPKGGKALLRISDLDVTEFQTLASLGIPMHVIGINARLLRDLAGNDMTYYSNSITLGGGESIDVILDASDTTKYKPGQTYYLYTPNLDHLSNDAENFGGLMTEIHICGKVNPNTKIGTNCN
jgi:FtsP/CotA-like multicopper oxidase with cupredoxin domain